MEYLCNYSFVFHFQPFYGGKKHRITCEIMWVSFKVDSRKLHLTILKALLRSYLGPGGVGSVPCLSPFYSTPPPPSTLYSWAYSVLGCTYIPYFPIISRSLVQSCISHHLPLQGTTDFEILPVIIFTDSVSLVFLAMVLLYCHTNLMCILCLYISVEVPRRIRSHLQPSPANGTDKCSLNTLTKRYKTASALDACNVF